MAVAHLLSDPRCELDIRDVDYLAMRTHCYGSGERSDTVPHDSEHVTS